MLDQKILTDGIFCDFPPLKLDFVKSDLEAVGLDNEDEYKVVTHCLDQKIGEELLLKEYLIYELYRIITPMSLRAKLLDLVYVDDTREERISKKAILLESEKEFAKNNGGKLCNCMGTSPDSLDGRNMEIVAMFQYMIGNSDMDYKVERNVTLIKPEDGGPWHSVAYDFDFSSFVNAPYVHPKVVDNRQIKRVYLGFRQNASLLPEVINLFLSKEDQIYACIDNFDMISNKERRNCLKYIKEFYSEIKQEDFAFPYQVNLNGH